MTHVSSLCCVGLFYSNVAWVADRPMEYYGDESLQLGHSPLYQHQHGHGDIGGDSTVHGNGGGGGVGVAVARDGSCVYAVSEVCRAENGDVIATVADANAADDTAKYSFLKYVV